VRSQGYWKSCRVSKANGERRVFGLCRRAVGSSSSLAGRREGGAAQAPTRRIRCDSHHQKHFSMVLRSTEGDTPLVLGKRMDHSVIRWGLQRIPAGYVERAIELLFEPHRRAISARFLHPGRDGSSNLRARVTRGQAHVSPQPKHPIEGFKGAGELFPADAGHNSADNYLLVKGHSSSRDQAPERGAPRTRRGMAESFERHRNIYGCRELIEGVFGGTKNEIREPHQVQALEVQKGRLPAHGRLP